MTRRSQQMRLPLYQVQPRKLQSYWERALRDVGASSPEEAVRRLYASGLSIRQVARQLTFSYATIHRVLRQMGFPTRPPGGNNNPYGRAGKPAEKT